MSATSVSRQAPGIPGEANVVNAERKRVDDNDPHTHLVVPDDKSRLQRAPYAKTREDFEVKYTGECFCGTVKFEIAEDPLGEWFSVKAAVFVAHTCLLPLIDASYCHW